MSNAKANWKQRPQRQTGEMEIVSTPAEGGRDVALGAGIADTQANGPDWTKVSQLDSNSLEGRWQLEKWSLVREVWRSHVRMVTFYTSADGGKLSMAEAIKRASAELGEEATEEDIKRLASQSVDDISWYSLDRIFRSDPDYAQLIWEDIKEQALADFKSGHYAAELFERTDWQKDVWQRAHFVAVFEGMLEEYKPRGAIELSMVEMVAVQYFLWRHWTMEHLQRAKTKPRSLKTKVLLCLTSGRT